MRMAKGGDLTYVVLAETPKGWRYYVICTDPAEVRAEEVMLALPPRAAGPGGHHLEEQAAMESAGFHGIELTRSETWPDLRALGEVEKLRINRKLRQGFALGQILSGEA